MLWPMKKSFKMFQKTKIEHVANSDLSGVQEKFVMNPYGLKKQKR